MAFPVSRARFYGNRIYQSDAARPAKRPGCDKLCGTVARRARAAAIFASSGSKVGRRVGMSLAYAASPGYMEGDESVRSGAAAVSLTSYLALALATFILALTPGPVVVATVA